MTRPCQEEGCGRPANFAAKSRRRAAGGVPADFEVSGSMNSLTLDEVYVSGVEKRDRVVMSFAHIDLNIDVASARKLARALLDQADVAELEAMR